MSTISTCLALLAPPVDFACQQIALFAGPDCTGFSPTSPIPETAPKDSIYYYPHAAQAILAHSIACLETNPPINHDEVCAVTEFTIRSLFTAPERFNFQQLPSSERKVTSAMVSAGKVSWAQLFRAKDYDRRLAQGPTLIDMMFQKKLQLREITSNIFVSENVDAPYLPIFDDVLPYAQRFVESCLPDRHLPQLPSSSNAEELSQFHKSVTFGLTQQIEFVKLYYNDVIPSSTKMFLNSMTWMGKEASSAWWGLMRDPDYEPDDLFIEIMSNNIFSSGSQDVWKLSAMVHSESTLGERWTSSSSYDFVKRLMHVYFAAIRTSRSTFQDGKLKTAIDRLESRPPFSIEESSHITALAAVLQMPQRYNRYVRELAMSYCQMYEPTCRRFDKFCFTESATFRKICHHLGVTKNEFGDVSYDGSTVNSIGSSSSSSKGGFLRETGFPYLRWLNPFDRTLKCVPLADPPSGIKDEQILKEVAQVSRMDELMCLEALRLRSYIYEWSVFSRMYDLSASYALRQMHLVDSSGSESRSGYTSILNSVADRAMYNGPFHVGSAWDHRAAVTRLRQRGSVNGLDHSIIGYNRRIMPIPRESRASPHTPRRIPNRALWPKKMLGMGSQS